MKYGNLFEAFDSFLDQSGPGILYEEEAWAGEGEPNRDCVKIDGPYRGLYTLGMEEIYKKFNGVNVGWCRYPVNKQELHAELLHLYSLEGLDMWWGLNSESGKAGDKNQVEVEYGLQLPSTTVWDEHFNTHYEDEYGFNHYHPVMLKLFIKKCIWDVIFPGEILPNYTEPTSSYLPSFATAEKIEKVQYYPRDVDKY